MKTALADIFNFESPGIAVFRGLGDLLRFSIPTSPGALAANLQSSFLAVAVSAPEEQSMLIDDLETLEQLGKIVVRLTSNPALREDLMQEALIHLWQVQEQNPGQTKNWYLQNCRYRLLHYLALGRSVDSPKRRASQVHPAQYEEDSEDWLDHFQGSDTVLEDVSARDILSSLSKVLSPREISILQWLAEGQGTREIAKKLGISHPMVIKHRRKIAALAKKLSIEAPSSAKESNPSDQGVVSSAA